jgi:ketosteroid isomerase-like protein
MKNLVFVVVLLALGVSVAVGQQGTNSDQGGRLLALEKAWNLALEQKDVKALDMLLAPTFVSVDSDGSLQSKSEFLASIKSPDYQPSQAVTEQSNVQVYGDAAVVVGIFRIKVTEKGKMRDHEAGCIRVTRPNTTTPRICFRPARCPAISRTRRKHCLHPNCSSRDHLELSAFPIRADQS